MAARKKKSVRARAQERPWLAAHWFPVVLVALLLLAAATRVYGAWAFRFITDGDSGVVALMARHMALGRPWPVFFYGQAYMGSFEPAVSALVCRLLGIHGFSVCLGSALLAILALIPLALWARDTGGRVAALVAVAVCIFGPRTYYLFQFAPRGGYMAALLFGTWVMFYGSRMAAHAWSGRQVGAGSFLLLGVGAGLGWWSNAIVTPALAATALVLCVGLRGRFWIGPVWAGLAGFLVGSAPFWLWNFSHDWASFALLSSLGTRSLADGAHLLWPRFLVLVTPDHWSMGLRTAAAVCFLLPAVWGLVAGLVQSRKGWNAGYTCAVLFVVLSVVVFIRSDYASAHTGRYLLPLIPAFALLAGVAVAGTRRPWGIVPAVVVLVILGFQAAVLKEVTARDRATEAGWEGAHKLADLLTSAEIEAVYSHFGLYSFNFLFEERWAFTDMRSDRYLPIAQRAELSEQVAVLGNFGPVADFLVISGGRAALDRAGPFRVEHGFVPPPEGWRAIEPGAIAALTDRRGRDLAPALLDQNEDTTWDNSGGDPDLDCLEVRFASPQNLRAIRLLGPPGSIQPGVGRVDVRRPGSPDWEAVLPDHPVPAFMWSGPRPYWSRRADPPGLPPRRPSGGGRTPGPRGGRRAEGCLVAERMQLLRRRRGADAPRRLVGGPDRRPAGPFPFAPVLSAVGGQPYPPGGPGHCRAALPGGFPRRGSGAGGGPRCARRRAGARPRSAGQPPDPGAASRELQ